MSGVLNACLARQKCNIPPHTHTHARTEARARAAPASQVRTRNGCPRDAPGGRARGSDDYNSQHSSRRRRLQSEVVAWRPGGPRKSGRARGGTSGAVVASDSGKLVPRLLFWDF